MPGFETALPQEVVFDFDTEGPFDYTSPKAIDKENNTISMSLSGLEGFAYFSVKKDGNAFKVTVDPSLVKDDGLGKYTLKVKLTDDISSDSNDSFLKINLKRTVIESEEEEEDNEQDKNQIVTP